MSNIKAESGPTTLVVAFEMEKDTKNTIRFKETGVGPLDVPKIGTIYVPKVTLKEIGYEAGNELKVSIAAIK